MKKLFFTIVFLSVISFVGISKVKALPIGTTFDEWSTKSVLVGNIKNDLGANMPLYGYNGSGYSSCPYLSATNQLSELGCYNQSSYNSNTSLLINSTPVCNAGNCTSEGSILNITIGLSEQDFLEANEQYTLTLNIGLRNDIDEQKFQWFKSVFDTGRNFQIGYGSISNYNVVCYHSTDDSDYLGQNYCSLSFDFVPDRLVGVWYADFTMTYMSLADFNYYVDWILYPKIELNEVIDYTKYTLKSNEVAFISGIRQGSIYYPIEYYVKNRPFALYFDKEVNAQESYNWLKYPSFTSNNQYFYDEFYISEPNDLIVISTESWNDVVGGYPYSKLEFYVSPDTYVDIVVPQYTKEGMIHNFNYKDPTTGTISNITHNSSYFPAYNDENVNKIFQTIFNNNDNGFLFNFSEYWNAFNESKIKSYFLLICFGGLGIYIIHALSR